MCTTCGCEHSHDHPHDHAHLDPRTVRVERDLLEKNDALAAQVRRHLAGRGIFAVNLVSSPGSGKTTLLVKTIEALRGRRELGVIEGDQETSRDAERIRAAGARAVQVNTGQGCHLDAGMVGHALEHLAPAAGSVLMIENVGNLVCPAAFDLGESARVVVLSVTEGDDKPLKYPGIFRGSQLMLINKVDLLPYVEFDAARCVEYARRVNPGIRTIALSAAKGQGMAEWLDWIEGGLRGRPLASADAWTAA
ncbi:MAG TPA: hydrogenase nickel incorporation protein HypB [Burkholderiales bacterium]|nr:hydrogenase nickel incorporation protein HypB [Burkholderiales bacterium]